MTKNMTVIDLAIRASLVGMAAVLLIAPAAHAQRQTRITSKSVDAYAELLELDAEQIEIAKALHAAYLTDISEEPITPAETAEASLFDDLRLILNYGQAARWVRVERLRRRETLLTGRMLSGASLDLIDITKSVGGLRDLGPEVAAALKQYEIQLDRALIARSDARRRMRDTVDSVRRKISAELKGDSTVQSLLEGLEGIDMVARDASVDVSKVGLQLRNLNDRFVRTIEPLLPTDLAPTFRAVVLQQSFPQIYKQSKMERLFSAAESLDDLTDEQRLSLSELRVSYARDRAVADKRWSEAIREKEDGTGDSSAVGKARQARSAMDDRYEDKLLKLLNLDQQQRLPTRDSSTDTSARNADRRALDQAKAEARDRKRDR